MFGFKHMVIWLNKIRSQLHKHIQVTTKLIQHMLAQTVKTERCRGADCGIRLAAKEILFCSQMRYFFFVRIQIMLSACLQSMFLQIFMNHDPIPSCDIYKMFIICILNVPIQNKMYGIANITTSCVCNFNKNTNVTSSLYHSLNTAIVSLTKTAYRRQST